MTFQCISFKRKISLVMVLLLGSILLMGCNPYYGLEPYQETATWVSLDPDIRISYKVDEDGITTAQEVLVWDGETIDLDIGFQSSQYCAFRKDSHSYEDRLFSGEWSYRNGKLIFSLEEDLIFEGKYGELVLETEDHVEIPREYARQETMKIMIGIGVPMVIVGLIVARFIIKRKKADSGSPSGNAE